MKDPQETQGILPHLSPRPTGPQAPSRSIEPPQKGGLSKATGSCPSAGRDRISNDPSRIGPGVPGRSARSRRWKCLFHGYTTAAQAVGAGLVKENLCRYLATVTLALDDQAALVARGERVDLDALARLNNSYHKTIESLGIQLQPTPTNPKPAPTLAELLKKDNPS